LASYFTNFFWGVTPFGGESVDETFQKLTTWKEYVQPPEPLEDEEEPITEEGWALISGLLSEKEERLGRENIEEIKNSAFFKGFEWDQVQSMDPPFVPELDDELDTSYFQNALDEEDIEALTPIAAEIINPDPLNAPQLPLTSVDPTLQSSDGTKQASTYFKNDYETMAFAGWTFKHSDLTMLLERVNAADK